MQLSGNTILITGATAGIGQAFAEEFHRRGNTVIVCGRREERLREMEAKMPGLVTRVADLSKADDRESLAMWVISKYPAMNILMNNAGIQLVTDLTKPVDLESVSSEIETNLIAPIHLSSLFAEHLAKQENAAIINISSGLAFAPIAFMPVYCATKAAIHSFTMSQRYQLRNTGIKVFEVAPPSVDTELGHQRRADKSETHGGMPVSEFLAEAMQALEADKLEALIAGAAFIRANPEQMFERMNAQAR